MVQYIRRAFRQLALDRLDTLNQKLDGDTRPSRESQSYRNEWILPITTSDSFPATQAVC